MNTQNQVKVIAWRKPTGYSRYTVSNADKPQIIDTKPAAIAKASKSQRAASRRPEVRERRIRAQQRRRANERFAKVAKSALDEIRQNIELALIQAEDSLGVLDQQISDMEVD